MPMSALEIETWILRLERDNSGTAVMIGGRGRTRVTQAMAGAIDQ